MIGTPHVKSFHMLMRWHTKVKELMDCPTSLPNCCFMSVPVGEHPLFSYYNHEPLPICRSSPCPNSSYQLIDKWGPDLTPFNFKRIQIFDLSGFWHL